MKCGRAVLTLLCVIWMRTMGTAGEDQGVVGKPTKLASFAETWFVYNPIWMLLKSLLQYDWVGGRHYAHWCHERYWKIRKSATNIPNVCGGNGGLCSLLFIDPCSFALELLKPALARSSSITYRSLPTIIFVKSTTDGAYHRRHHHLEDAKSELITCERLLNLSAL